MRTISHSALWAALVWAGAACFAQAPRAVVPFNSDWRFYRGDPEGASAVGFADDSWQKVALPHTWNAEDALPGNAFYQGPGWYRKEFSALPGWKGRRVFIRFGAASLTADVYLNGAKLGDHKGGFAAFCFEITQALHSGDRNTLAVRVDNTRGSISPLGGDFTIFGGLYRPVSLIVTGPVAITPLDYAGPGVYLKQTAVSDARAEVDVTTRVANGGAQTGAVTARVTVLDAQRRTVVTARTNGDVKAGGTGEIRQTLIMPKPHLWKGVADPYLYTARIDLLEGGKVIDTVEQPLGLRYFRADPERGFVLNGKPMQIHGVCLHQEGGPMGWAVTEKDEDADMAVMREMGVNGVRLVHYQHSDRFHTLCDRNGVLAWSELALVNNVRYTDEFRLNVRQQLTELIRQNFNHPAIVMWSMYNEVGSRDKPGPLIKELSDLAHAEDPTRLTTGAASGDTMANAPDAINPLDLVSLNLYQGWYSGKPEDLGPELDRYNQKYGSKGVALSEYGAGASVHQHEQGMTQRPNPNGKWHPEEWQAIQHEAQLPIIQARPYIWGSFLWVMFDFASVGRHEGDTDGINDKGLVTRDRAIKKDAFYYYKANWNPEPMIYITSRRDTERKATNTAVKVYSTCPKVTLKVNGKDMGEAPMTAPHVFALKDVTLAEGENRIEAAGNANGRMVRDSCQWTYRK
jgi:beta-galactosidase